LKITAVHDGVVPISSSIRNAWIDFSSMDCSIVAVVSDVMRDGEPIVGYGFNSNGRFYANASEVLGMAPTDFREGGAGQDIRFAVRECRHARETERPRRERRVRHRR